MKDRGCTSYQYYVYSLHLTLYNRNKRCSKVWAYNEDHIKFRISSISSRKTVISKEVVPVNSRWGPHITEKVHIQTKRSSKTVISKEIGPVNSRSGPHIREKARILSKMSGKTVLSKLNLRWGAHKREKVRLFQLLY